jgi:hypothetical protein
VFTGRIGPLPVLFDRMTAAPEALYALNLSCRDGNERTAVACTRDSLGCYSGADLALKKIDSLLRGHWAAELAEIVNVPPDCAGARGARSRPPHARRSPDAGATVRRSLTDQ